MSLKLVVDDISTVNEAQRGLYEKKEDGKHYLIIEGDLPNPALVEANKKVAEFRDSNIGLKKKIEDIENRMKTFEGLDPVEYKKLKDQVDAFEKRGAKDPSDIDARIKAAVEPLQTQIVDFQTREKSAKEEIKRRDLQSSLRDVAAKSSVRESALEDFLARGSRAFDLDGRAVNTEGNPVYSEESPAEPLSTTEWAKGLVKTAPHLFEDSKGGGAPPDGVRTPAAREVSGLDPLEFGRNIEDIATGKVTVGK